MSVLICCCLLDFSHTVCGFRHRKLAKNGCYCLLNFYPHLKLPAQVERQKIQALGSLFFPVSCFLADSVRVRLVLCRLTRESRQHWGPWADGKGSWVMEEGQRVTSGGILLTSDQRKHLGETQKEVTGTNTSPVVFDRQLIRHCDAHMMYEQAPVPPANVNHESAVWTTSPKHLFNFWMKCKTADFQVQFPCLEPVQSERNISIIHVEAACRLRCCSCEQHLSSFQTGKG